MKSINIYYLLPDTGHQKGAYLSEWLQKPLHHLPI